MKTKIAIAAILLVALGAAVLWWAPSSRSEVASATTASANKTQDTPPGTAQPQTEGAGELRTVTLDKGKLATLEIQTAPLALHTMQVSQIVPGRIRYDDARHVDIRAAAGGVLIDVRVTPGDRVIKGQVLGLLSSPELGTARTEVHHSRERWGLAERKRDWEREICTNVAALVDGLKSRVPIADLEKRFQGKTLGKSREVLISAYSRYLLAQELAKRADTGHSVLPATTLAERRAERQSTEAALLAACEQSEFDAMQRKRAAEIESENALRRLHIAQEQLTTLLGYSPDTVSEAAAEGDVLSRVEIRAPFAGTIEDRHFARSERVKASDSIFVLADTSALWVAADLREQDWKALALSQGAELTFEVPALAGRKLKGKVHFLGRQVTTESNSVPLIASISNTDGELRPGMFARVSLPVGAPKKVLAVPAEAVVSHEGAHFVFVPTGPSTFQRTDVVTWQQTDDLIEIEGIAAGTPVVIKGAAALKAALLLPTLKKED